MSEDKRAEGQGLPVGQPRRCVTLPDTADVVYGPEGQKLRLEIVKLILERKKGQIRVAAALDAKPAPTLAEEVDEIYRIVTRGTVDLREPHQMYGP